MSESNEAEIDQTIALYLVIAVIVSLGFAIWGLDKPFQSGEYTYQPGVAGRVFLFLFLIPGGFCGITIGRKVRDAIVPDFVMTNSTGELVKEKIFWAIGPQAIGLLLGMALTGGGFLTLMARLFG